MYTPDRILIQPRVYPSMSAAAPLPCSRFSSCLSCHLDPNCIWHEGVCADYNASSRPVYKKPTCSFLCTEHTTCDNCTGASGGGGGGFHFSYSASSGAGSECVWCASQHKCVPKKAVHVFYPFGECMELMSERAKCERPRKRDFNPPPPNGTYTPNTSPLLTVVVNRTTEISKALEETKLVATMASKLIDDESPCSREHTNCSSCIRDERCGWCSSDQTYNGTDPRPPPNTGLGKCMEGGLSSPSSCNLTWFFGVCPPCECNGHSQCSGTNKTVCAQPCWNNTQGEFCDSCADGFYGQAQNGGVCAPCQCGQQASLCDPRKGGCFCNTKGVIGHKCDQCDSPRYTGRPDLSDGSCFYNCSYAHDPMAIDGH